MILRSDGVRCPLDVHESHAVGMVEVVVAVFSEDSQNLIGDPIQDFLSRFCEGRHGKLGKMDKDLHAVPQQQL